MAIRKFDVTDAIHEQSDTEYTCTFHDAGAAGVTLDADAILTIAATLSDIKTGTIINERDEQDVLNVNGGALTSEGVFTLRLTGNTDNVVVTESALSTEQHRLTLEVTYRRDASEDTGYLNHEVRFYVLRLTDVEVEV